MLRHNAPKKSGEKNKKFKIEKLSENTRKTILTITIIVIMLVIILFWLNSLRTTLGPAKEDSTSEEWQSIKESFTDLINNTGENFGGIKNQFIRPAEQKTTSTTAIELLPEEVEKIK